MSLKLGQVTTLVISSATAAKEVLQKQDLAFCTRHIPDVLHAQDFCDYAASFIPVGTQWRTLRKIFYSNLSSNKALDASQLLRSEKVKELVAYCRKASVSNEELEKVIETLRLHPPIPLLLPRKTTVEVKLNEYRIPKGTQVLVNAWAIGRDTCMWDDSEEFKPERFLASSVDVRGQDFELFPFGGGRRICPGMPIALRMISLMWASLLNNFNWNLDMKIQSNDLDLNERFGITIQKANPLYVVPIPLN